MNRLVIMVILFVAGHASAADCTNVLHAVTIDRYGNETPRCDNASSLDPWITAWDGDTMDIPQEDAPPLPPPGGVPGQTLIERILPARPGALSFFGIAHQPPAAVERGRP